MHPESLGWPEKSEPGFSELPASFAFDPKEDEAKFFADQAQADQAWDSLDTDEQRALMEAGLIREERLSPQVAEKTRVRTGITFDGRPYETSSQIIISNPEYNLPKEFF